MQAFKFTLIGYNATNDVVLYQIAKIINSSPKIIFKTYIFYFLSFQK
ncbi:hypothetical protein HMPREF0201_03653 [Cedecea davisae DSM 4568]|uniref:Uncharacterized protein n=1 Tax=Cedecea davisae DSM 4568 TaxID=566551 RepID=S3IPJ8_9ENTR|nr:hypothetical protein HMPREF0201_03653 [Cedecea davisae DSM 4568]